MTILTHAVFAGVVGGTTNNLLLAPVSGLFSHFLLDFLPHNDYLYLYAESKKNPYTTKTSFLLLGLTGLFLLYEFIFLDPLRLGPWLLGSLFGILPDAYTGFKATLKIKPNLLDNFHNRTHHQLSLAEFLNNHCGLIKISQTKGLLENYQILKVSRWAQFGWLLELSFEFLLLIFVLKRSGLGF